MSRQALFAVCRSYCPDHRPAQTLSVSSELSLPQSCSICLDAIEPVLGYALLKCPCCHSSWFHRDCVQVHNLGGFMCERENVQPSPFVMADHQTHL